MWEMPVWMLIGLIVIISIVIYFLLRPLKVLRGREWAISHVFVIIGLVMISAWLWLNKGNHLQMSMLIGGLWTISGGTCFAVTYVLRKLR